MCAGAKSVLAQQRILLNTLPVVLLKQKTAEIMKKDTFSGNTNAAPKILPNGLGRAHHDLSSAPA
tara:strand:+ start:147 stop:341 length:195 start_codon:yes stop_codon:yes gene_type:complete